MSKVKNSPENYVKRSQVRSASVVADCVTDAHSKRTAEDFAEAVIDRNFYVIFHATSKQENGES